MMQKLTANRFTGAIVLCLALIALFAEPARAQLAVSVKTDRSQVHMDDTLRLEVVISGGTRNTGALEMEGLDSFEVLNRSRSEQVSIVNLSITRSKVYSYVLRPLYFGKTVKLRAKVKDGGKLYESNVKEVKLLKAGGGGGTSPPPSPPPPGRRRGLFDNDFFGMFGGRRVNRDDFLVQAKVSSPSVYVGQEVVYTMTFYRAAEVWSPPEVNLPEMKGFWTEQLPENKKHASKMVDMAGKRYMATDFYVILYPISAGESKIGVGTVRFQTDPFSSPMGLKSREITLKVRPLPKKGKPKNFTGLVGEFRISARFKNDSAQAGKPVTLIVTVSGGGNLHQIKEPARPVFNGVEIYEPETNDEFSRTAAGSSGSRSFTYILVPQKEGKLEIGPFKTSYFDPSKGEYVEIGTDPITINVAASGEQTAGAPDGVGAIPLQARRNLERLSTGIRYIKPDVKTLLPEGLPYYRRPVFYIYPAALLAVLGFYIIYVRRRRRLLSDSEYARAMRAKRLARERLNRAGKFLKENDSEGFYGEMDRAVRQYIADKFNVPPTSISREMLDEKLSAINGNVIDRISQIFDQCESARFAGKSANTTLMKKLLEDSKTVIQELEKKIG